MRSRRLPIGLLVPGALVLLVALLATLQYRWLGQVSEAERDRLRTSLRQSAEDFADDFDRELTRTYTAFLQVDGSALMQHDWSAFVTRYDKWHDAARDPQVIQAIYLATDDGTKKAFFKYAPEAKAFEAATWPEPLAPVRASIAGERMPVTASSGRLGSAVSGGVAAGSTAERTVVALHESMFPSVPAIVIALPAFPAFQSFTFSDVRGLLSMRFGTASLVVALDRDHIRTTLLPALVARYFSRGGDLYRFAVIDSTDASHPVYSRGLAAGATLDPAHADATVPLFALRSDLVSQVMVRPATSASSTEQFTVNVPAGKMPPVRTTPVRPPPPPPVPVMGTSMRSAQTMSIVVDARGGRGDVFNFTTRPVPRPAWQLVLQHSAGSLDAAVGQARRRNLWLSFSILAVLVAGVGLIVINAERSRKLAIQQMDFVATVSHELRTPLTVIRSAAQNLSAGVVSDPTQAKRYGDLIEAEGRRLTDMVEQVLEYAGLGGNRRLAQGQPIDAGAVTRDVIESSAALFDADRVEVQLDVAEDLPAVVADEGALRRALNNLVTNALKYGADGRWIGVSVRRGGARIENDEVQISVRDRGRGIDADDLPHIFEAFYRGRYAVDRQIHGNGLGLSLVKRIAEAHGGRVTVTSVPGDGATFTIHLPAAAPDPAAVHPLTDPAPDAGGPNA
jgi:signal transduction histidine kinase